MFKSIKAVLCVALSAAFALTGCNGGNSQKSESSETSSASSSSSDGKTQTSQAETVPTEPVPATPDSREPVDDENITYNSYEIKKNLDEIEATLDELLEDNGYNGVVYVKFGNDFEKTRAFGSANMGAHIRNSIHTKMYVGELTQFVTALAVMKLVEDNNLNLQTTIDKYFPKCPYAKDVTIEQLLTMKSAIPDYVVSEDGKLKTLVPQLEKLVSEENGAEKNKQAVLNWILSQPRETSHGISFDFSNSNYFLLGEIIAKESKTSYEDYVSQHIFTPLHMTKSCFVSDENTSIPYTGTEQSAKLLCGGVGYSSLGMITNVSNLLELIDGLMTNSIISEATFKKLFTDYGGGYGYGVYVSGIRATGIGGIDAFSAKMSFTTNNNQIYVALSNDSESNPDKIHTLFRDYLMKFRN